MNIERRLVRMTFGGYVRHLANLGNRDAKMWMGHLKSTTRGTLEWLGCRLERGDIDSESYRFWADALDNLHAQYQSSGGCVEQVRDSADWMHLGNGGYARKTHRNQDG